MFDVRFPFGKSDKAITSLEAATLGYRSPAPFYPSFLPPPICPPSVRPSLPPSLRPSVPPSL